MIRLSRRGWLAPLTALVFGRSLRGESGKPGVEWFPWRAQLLGADGKPLRQSWARPIPLNLRICGSGGVFRVGFNSRLHWEYPRGAGAGIAYGGVRLVRQGLVLATLRQAGTLWPGDTVDIPVLGRGDVRGALWEMDKKTLLTWLEG